MNDSPSIAVIGLGYVGLPLAVGLARHFPVTGFDVSADRVAELRAGRDRTGEVAADILRSAALTVTGDAADVAGRDLYIVTVPTPVDSDNQPDLSLVRAASRTVGGAMRSGAVVVFESTVYPGVTEDICGPDLEAASGLVCGRDFFLGYSPERINPGDRDHTVERIVKVIAGQTPRVTDLLTRVYGSVNGGQVFAAADIRTAEAAKAIENAQRDINIAFMNEVAQICRRLDISVHDVLAAARTKWNFLPFTPGLVGGHCIGVDPYYLSHCAQEVGHHPRVILAGRATNDGMGAFIAGEIAREVAAPGRVLILGLTFKEDVPDLRNSRVIDVALGLRRADLQVRIHDPLANPAEAKREYGIDLLTSLDGLSPFDAVVGCVAHRAYRAMTADDLARLTKPGGLIADVKGQWRGLPLPADRRAWSL